MKLNKDTKILIIGLGVMGGSYAAALSRKGYRIKCITKEAADVRYGLENGMICYGTTEVEPELVKEAELVIFALYPTAFISWVEKYQGYFTPGTLITDVTGVKSEVVYKVQEILREDVEYIAAHPMAGRERSGVEYADPTVFNGANYIVTPTERNSLEAIKLCKALGEELGFLRISELTPESHDEMIAFPSQLAHVVSNAYVKSPTAKSHAGFSAGSYKDLTRVARLNEDMWTMLFLENRAFLKEELDTLIGELTKYRDALAENDADTLHALLKEGRECKEAIDGK